MTQMTIDKRNGFLSPKQHKNLHPEAYEETFNVIDSFFNVCKTSQLDNSKHYWVCDSSPGHGKTTALAVRVKQLIKRNEGVPLLIVFNNKDTMANFFRDIIKYMGSIERVDMIQYVDADNFEYVSDSMFEYRILCITQQRLRDLAVGIGNSESYLNYGSYENGLKKRSVIIDEMPIITNDCDFDVSSKFNSVDWFDSMASASDLSSIEKSRGRLMVMLLVVEELALNETNTTLRLERSIERSERGDIFVNILSRLKKESCSREHYLKFQWFMKLFKNDNVGYIDRHKDGNRIICSEHISYTKFSKNILILDGTSKYTETLYNGEYEYKNVKNYHDYSGRLNIHWRNINTSSSSRKSEGLNIQNTIALDINKIRSLGVQPFPLMQKSDIKHYINNGVISIEQHNFFKEFKEEDEDIPLNLLNTTGKNVLSEYNSLVLLNPPIRNPTYYKKVALGLLGSSIDLSMAEKGFNRWFKDEQVEKIYQECVMADLLQIIHRCKIRLLNDSTLIHIYLYTNRKEIINRLKTVFNLPDKNLSEIKLIDSENFMVKCSNWSQVAKTSLNKNNNTENHVFAEGLVAGKIGGRSFKDWLNRNWNDEKRKIEIIRIFDEADIFIQETINGKKFWLKEDKSS